jgi:hypothetical protein
MLTPLHSDHRTWHKVVTKLPEQHKLGTLWPIDAEQKRFLDERTQHWCWQAQPGYNVIYIEDDSVAILFKLTFAG